MKDVPRFNVWFRWRDGWAIHTHGACEYWAQVNMTADRMMLPVGACSPDEVDEAHA
jgi:hypothetical protein